MDRYEGDDRAFDARIRKIAWRQSFLPDRSAVPGLVFGVAAIIATALFLIFLTGAIMLCVDLAFGT
jgi:hypothetical protein